MQKSLTRRLAPDFDISLLETDKRRVGFDLWQFDYVCYFVCPSLDLETGEVAGCLDHGLAKLTFTCRPNHTLRKRKARKLLHAKLSHFLDTLHIKSVASGFDVRLLNLSYDKHFSMSMHVLHRRGSDFQLGAAILHLPSRHGR